MDPFGTTRSRVCANHALIVPESFVPAALPGWEKTRCVVLVSPALGARFVQYLALMEPGATAAPAAPGIERMLFVLEGEITVSRSPADERTLEPGGFAFLPSLSPRVLRSATMSRACVFEKRYVPCAGIEPPTPLFGHERDVPGAPFLGDPDAVLQALLPDTPAFDMAVNVFSFRPGATLPMVEVHMMEHGLLMLEGQGVYRLADSWYPVREGDAIWMASYCPQWFVATGKGRARYLYYKDVNRDPLGMEARP
jgi:(S)-ureidoglycine aminohydrolase